MAERMGMNDDAYERFKRQRADEDKRRAELAEWRKVWADEIARRLK
jgi:hypothetical protein